MTKEEIRKAYLDSIEGYITGAEQYADDVNFDNLRAVCNSPYGYKLFYPFSSAFSSKEGMEFGALCELYDWLKYCWTDDGSASFVCATVSTDLYLNKQNKYDHDIIFVMRGDRDELSWDEVSKFALFHNSGNTELIKYSACVFNERSLYFLFDLIPEFVKIEALGRNATGMKLISEYYQMEKDMEKVFADHISKHQFTFSLDLDTHKQNLFLEKLG